MVLLLKENGEMMRGTEIWSILSNKYSISIKQLLVRMEIRKKGNMSRTKRKESTFSHKSTRRDSLSFIKTMIKYLDEKLDL